MPTTQSVRPRQTAETASPCGIALIPHSYSECGPRGLVYREIVDSTLELSVGLAWRKGTRNAALLNLIRVVREMNL